MKKTMMIMLILALLIPTSGCVSLFGPSVEIEFEHPELGKMHYIRRGEQKIQDLKIDSEKVSVSLEGQEVKDTATTKALDAINKMLEGQDKLLNMVK